MLKVNLNKIIYIYYIISTFRIYMTLWFVILMTALNIEHILSWKNFIIHSDIRIFNIFPTVFIRHRTHIIIIVKPLSPYNNHFIIIVIFIFGMMTLFTFYTPIKLMLRTKFKLIFILYLRFLCILLLSKPQFFF